MYDFSPQGRCPFCRLSLNRLCTQQSNLGAFPGHVHRASQEAGNPGHRGQILGKRRRRAQQGVVQPLQPKIWPHSPVRDFPVPRRRGWVPACHKAHLAHASGRGRLAFKPCHPISSQVVTRCCHGRRSSGGQGDHRPRGAHQADRRGGEGWVSIAQDRSQAWRTPQAQEGCQRVCAPGGAFFKEGTKTEAASACSTRLGALRQGRWRWQWCQGCTRSGQGSKVERGVEALEAKVDHRWSSRSQPWRRGLGRRGRLERLHWVRGIRLRHL